MRHRIMLACVAILAFTLVMSNSVTVLAAHSIPSPASACPQPPSGVDLTTLSDAQLAVYGLPPKPVSTDRLAWWRNVLHHAKRRTCSSHPIKGTVRHSPLRSASSGIGPLYSREEQGSWAGVVATGYGYTQVSADWTFPCISQYTDYAHKVNSAVSPWIGIGGDSNDGGGPLIQVGSAQGYDETRTLVSYLWWEDYPYQGDPQFVDMSPAPTCGDSITAYVDNGTVSTYQPYFLIDNLTKGVYFGEHKPVPRANGSTAEWAVETNWRYLANFYGQTFTDAQAQRNGVQYSIGQLPTVSVRMRSCTYVSMAYPGPIHDGTYFNIWWQDYGC